MDSKLFRITTEPNFYEQLQTGTPAIKTHKNNSLFPAPDNRFPGWAGQMSDARLVTDYSNHCSKNIPVGKQFPTTLWMQRNAESLIDYSRKTHAIASGSIFPFDDSVIPPPSSKVSCTKSVCSRVRTGAEGGLGVERNESDLPELFGTFSSETLFPAGAKVAHTSLTSRFEGGRNSLRGDTQMSSAYY